MAEIIGAIERALGAALNGIYEVIPVYGVGIVLLTLAVRAMLIPLTVKQIKGMAATQKLQPEMKKIQAKYRGMQQKTKDRAEVQQLRLAMNKEIQELFQAHGASMFGGCLPALSQFPVLIAMFAVFRASIVAVPMIVSLNGSPVPATLFGDSLKSTICRPTVPPSANGPAPTQISCPTKDGDKVITIGDLRDGHDTEIKFSSAPWITACTPQLDANNKDQVVFRCQSQLGTGHLPRDGKLFTDITQDRASLFGLRASCSASQVQSEQRIKECTTKGETGGTAKAIPYYLLVLLVAGTTWYQSKQMMARSSGQALQQQQMMTKIMPVLFGFLSISFPSALNLYMLTTNMFSIGQQGLLFKRMGERLGLPQPGAAQAPKGKESKVIEAKKVEPEPPEAAADQARKKSNRSKKGKKRR